MTNPMISVVMPVYNAEKYVAEAVDSILQQTYSDFEFIIIDDCSTDSSYKILQEYAAKDQRIKLYRNEINSKLPKTLNFGISQSKGKYIARMDADDISLPERFAKQVEFMESHPEIGVCGSNCKIYSEDMNKLIKSTQYPLLSEMIRIYLDLFINPIVHSSVMIQATCLVNKFHYAQEMNSNAEDYDLWLKMSDDGIKFANLPIELIKYRSYLSQQSKINIKKINDWRKIEIKKKLRLLFPNVDYLNLADSYINIFIFPKKGWMLKYFISLNILEKLRVANEINTVYDLRCFELFLQHRSFISRLKRKFGYYNDET